MMAQPPQWATRLLTEVALDEHRSEVPELRWRRRADRREHSSGRYALPTECLPPRITVSTGKSRLDQKLVLLHEAAHWVTSGEHHSARFWDTAWRLFRRYRVPLRYALKREADYRKGAAVAYRRTKGGLTNAN